MLGDYKEDRDLLDLLSWDGKDTDQTHQTVDRGQGEEISPMDVPSLLSGTSSSCSSCTSASLEVRSGKEVDSNPGSASANELRQPLPHGEEGVLQFPHGGTSSGPRTSNSLTLPEEVQAALYPHQQEGVQWLFQRHCHARGALLADEMGLGKTVQVCAFLGQMYREGQIQSSIVVVPVTLLSFWVEMLSRWGGLHPTSPSSFSSPRSDSSVSSPCKRATQKEEKRERSTPSSTLASSSPPSGTFHPSRNIEGKEVVLVIQGDTKAKRESKWRRLALCSNMASSSNTSPCLVLTSYSVIRQDVPLVPSLRHTVVDYIILDESHQIRDGNSSVCQSVLELSARHRLALSGTPVMNSFEDMWSLFQFLDGGRCRTLLTTAGAASASWCTSTPESGDAGTALDTMTSNTEKSPSRKEKRKGKSVSSDIPSRAAFRAISRSILRGNERDATLAERGTADKELAQLQAVMNTFSLRREKHLVWPGTASFPPNETISGSRTSHSSACHDTLTGTAVATASSSSSTFSSTTGKDSYFHAAHMKSENGVCPSPSISSGITPISNFNKNPFSCKKYDMVVWVTLTDIQRKHYDTVLNIKAEAIVKGMESKRKRMKEEHTLIHGSSMLPLPSYASEDIEEVHKEDSQEENQDPEEECAEDGSTVVPLQEMLPDIAMKEKKNDWKHHPLQEDVSSTVHTSRCSPSPQPGKPEGGALGLLSLLRDVCQHPWLHLREDSFSTALSHLHTPPCEELGPVESGSKLIVAVRLIKQHLFPIPTEETRNGTEACRSRNELDNEKNHRLHKLKSKQKVLVFSQSKRMLRLLAALLEEEQIPFLRLDGEVKAEQRAALVDSFNMDDEENEEMERKKQRSEVSREGEGTSLAGRGFSFLSSAMRLKVKHVLPSYTTHSSPPSSSVSLSPLVALLSTQVGGTGLTFNTASCVILLDPSWNPAVDNQCVDRVHRIGQKYDQVFIYRLVTCGTVEEKMYRNQIFKMTAAMQSVRCLPRSLFSSSQKGATCRATGSSGSAKDEKEMGRPPLLHNEEKEEGAATRTEACTRSTAIQSLSSTLAFSSSSKEEGEDPLFAGLTTSSPLQGRGCAFQKEKAGVGRRHSPPPDSSSPEKESLSDRYQLQTKANRVLSYFTRIQLRNMFVRGEYDRSETAVHIENICPSSSMCTSLSCDTDGTSSLSAVGGREQRNKNEISSSGDYFWNPDIPFRRGVVSSVHQQLLKIPHVVDVNSNDPAVLFFEQVPSVQKFH